MAWAADAVELNFSSFEPSMGHITTIVLAPLARELSAASGGSLQIDMFLGGTLGRNPTQQLKRVPGDHLTRMVETAGGGLSPGLPGLPGAVRRTPGCSSVPHRS